MIDVTDEQRIAAGALLKKKSSMESYREAELPASAMLVVDLGMENVREAGYTTEELHEEKFPAVAGNGCV